MAAHQPLAASKQNRKVLAAVAVAALVAAAVGVVLSTRATGRQELVGSYSAKQSNSDMESYFDNLPGGLAKHSSHAKARRVDRPANHAKAGHSHKASRSVADDGLPITKKVQKVLTGVDKKEAEEHALNKKVLQSYKLQNPDFSKKMDKVHQLWLKTHDGLPTSKAEKKEYRALVNKQVGNIGDIVDKGIATVYPPGMDAKSFGKMLEKFKKSHKDNVMTGRTPVTHTARK